MELAKDILNKEIERREILLAVENNVLIQNDMSNEIGILKDSVKKLALCSVSQQRELFVKEQGTWLLENTFIEVEKIVDFEQYFINK